MKHKVTVKIKGVDRHELVELMVFSLPKTIRKIFGMAINRQEAQFFNLLGFKQEAKFKDNKKPELLEGIYSFYPKKKK